VTAGTAGLAGVLAHGLLALAVALALLASLSLLGFGLVPRRLLPGRAILSVPLGLSVGATIAGLASWLTGSLAGTRFVLPLLVLLLAGSARRLGEWGWACRRLGRRLAALARGEPLVASLAAVPPLLLLPQLLIPLVDSDGLRYHAALAKLFLLTGRVFLDPWDVHGALPEGGEMLFLAALRLGPPEATKWLHALFFLFVLSLLPLLVHRGRGSRRAALLAPFLFAAAPVVLAPAGAAFVDYFSLAHLGVAALLAGSGAAPLAVGLALAGAIATKWTAVPAAAGIVAWAWVSAPGTARRRPLLLLAALVLPAAVAAAPLMLRNGLATGDPFFPSGYGLAGRPIPGVSPDWRTRTVSFNSGTAGLLGIAWTDQEKGGRSDEVAGLQPLLGLVALPLAFRRKRLRAPLAMIVPTLLVLLLARPPTRLLIPAFFGLAAFGAEALLLLGRRLAPPLAVVACLPALLAAARLQFTLFGPADYLTGRLGREAFLARAVPGYRAAAFVNSLPPGGRVMALDFPALFYLSRPWLAEGTVNEPPLKVRLAAGDDADRLLAWLRREEVRFVVVTPGYGGGTDRALFPLAASLPEARAVAGLRNALRRVARLDGVDVFEVPGPFDRP
jgi:hypothetical protein